MHSIRAFVAVAARAAVLLAVLLALACGPAPTATPIPTETPLPRPTVPPGVWQPLSDSECEDLGRAVWQALRARPQGAIVPFEDPIGGESGGACQISLQGTGSEYENPLDVVDALRPVLEERGWREEMKYAAGGPTGVMVGYRMGNRLCLVSASWEPAHGIDCGDKPIADCGLRPDQQLYTITVTGARR